MKSLGTILYLLGARQVDAVTSINYVSDGAKDADFIVLDDDYSMWDARKLGGVRDGKVVNGEWVKQCVIAGRIVEPRIWISDSADKRKSGC
jgi:hypothetical protein